MCAFWRTAVRAWWWQWTHVAVGCVPLVRCGDDAPFYGASVCVVVRGKGVPPEEEDQNTLRPVAGKEVEWLFEGPDL